MPSFIQFLPVVCPVGVTDLRLFFTQEIDLNYCIRKLWSKMQSVQNEEEKTKKLF